MFKGKIIANFFVMRQNKLNLHFFPRKGREISLSYMLNVIHQKKVLKLFSDFSAENLIKKGRNKIGH